MRLARNLIVGVAIVLLAVLSIEGYLDVRRAYAMFETDMRADGLLLGHSIAAAISAATEKHIDHLRLEERNSRVIVRAVALDGSGVPGAPTTPVVDIVRGLAVRDAVQFKNADDRLYTYVRVPDQSRLAIELSEELGALDAHGRSMFMRAAVRTAVTAAAFIVLVLLVGSVYVGKPLKELGEMARRVGRGDYSQRLRLRRRDELRDLAETMNAMCDDLTRAAVRIEQETRSRIRAIEQLRHADRLATVGQLAAGVAHELGTPLNVISGHAKMIVTGEVSGDEALESAQIALEQTQRMTHIVSQLLDFSRARPAQRRDVGIEDIARSTVRMLASAAQKKSVTLGVEVLEPAVLGLLDAVQVQQALTNLVMNAIQAVPRGGQVAIEVTRAHAAEGGEFACLRVRDDGPGVLPEDRERIFEPFFTTKDVGEGTGLGLAVAIGLVRENGGVIQVTDRAGGGTVFSILLPLADVAQRSIA